MPPPKSKGKGKAKESLIPTLDVDDLSEGAIVSEPELEYDENASVEESDVTASEFEVSEAEDDDDDDEESEEEEYIKPRKSPRKQKTIVSDDDSANDEEDEAIMLDAAIQESLQSARPDRTGGAGSSKPNASSTSAAALRAAAAEKRLARENQNVDVDDFQMAFGTESEAESSEEEPLSKAKGKGKGKGKKNSKTVKIHDTTSTKFMSMAERRKQRAQDRKDARLAKKEEREMIKQLGRKLTHVSYRHIFFMLSLLTLRSSYRQKKPLLHYINITRSSRIFGETWKQLSK